jgi:hypothetical protein
VRHYSRPTELFFIGHGWQARVVFFPSAGNNPQRRMSYWIIPPIMVTRRFFQEPKSRA